MGSVDGAATGGKRRSGSGRHNGSSGAAVNGAKSAEPAELRRQLGELLVEINGLRGALAEGEARENATAELLRALASSSVDLRRALDDIAAAAARLGRADRVMIQRVEGDRFWGEAVFPPEDRPAAWGAQADGRVRGRPFAEFRGVAARAIRERRTLHVPDVEEAAGEYADALPAYRAVGVRAILIVPLLRDGRAMGAIGLSGARPTPSRPSRCAS